MKNRLKPKNRAHLLTGMVESVSKLMMFSNGILVLVIVLQVILRYVFGRGLVALEELEWHLWAVGFLFGIPYCLVKDLNIRMDLIYQNFPDRLREWLDVLVLLILVVPFVIVMLIHGIDFAEHSWNISERSEAPLGLPCRWIIKSMIPISMAVMALAVLARFSRFAGMIKRSKNGN